MFVKLYLHFNSLQAFNKGEWVNARHQFMGQDDLELLLPIDKLVMKYQQQGLVIRKRKWWEVLHK